MANELIKTLIKVSSLRIIDEQYGIAVWQDLRVKKCEITATAHTAQNPQSNFYSATDTQTNDAIEADLLTTKVVQPVAANVEVYAESISTAMSIATAFQNVTKTFQIMAKGVVAQGMSLSNVKIDQENTVLSAVKITLSFEQAAIPNTNKYDPSASGDSDTYGLKVQPTSGVVATVQSVYNKVSSLWS